MNEWLRLIAEHDPHAVPLLNRQEMVWVAAQDAERVRDLKRVAQGGCSRVEVHLAPALSVPLIAGTDRFTLLHNHPSGRASVSANDRRLTTTVLNAATVCGLTMVDHVILAGNQIVSLVGLGILAPAEAPMARAAE